MQDSEAAELLPGQVFRIAICTQSTMLHLAVLRDEDPDSAVTLAPVVLDFFRLPCFLDDFDQ